MTINQGMFTSKTDLWATPQEFFDKINTEFGFELDVCALPENAKCERFFTPEVDGLKQEWTGVVWMNPPYGNPEHACKRKCKKKVCEKRGYHVAQYIPGIVDWMEKAYEASLNGATVVCLVPARTDTEWWHDYCMKGEIRLVKGRLSFNDTGTAPFPSAVVIFGEYAKTNTVSAIA